MTILTQVICDFCDPSTIGSPARYAVWSHTFSQDEEPKHACNLCKGRLVRFLEILQIPVWWKPSATSNIPPGELGQVYVGREEVDCGDPEGGYTPPV